MAVGAGRATNHSLGPSLSFKMKRSVGWSQVRSARQLLFLGVWGLPSYVHMLKLSCPMYEEGTSPERKALNCSRLHGADHQSHEAHRRNPNNLRKVWPSHLTLEVSGKTLVCSGHLYKEKFWIFTQETLHRAPICPGTVLGNGAIRKKRLFPLLIVSAHGTPSTWLRRPVSFGWSLEAPVW